MDDCKGCKYHDDFSAVCVNADSPHVADFWHSGCIFKEIGEDGEREFRSLQDNSLMPTGKLVGLYSNPE